MASWFWRRATSWYMLGLLLLACSPLLYLVAYAANVRSVQPGYTISRGTWHAQARYRVGGEVAELLFGPANAVDRSLRPHLWTVRDPTDPTAKPHKKTFWDRLLHLPTEPARN